MPSKTETAVPQPVVPRPNEKMDPTNAPEKTLPIPDQVEVRRIVVGGRDKIAEAMVTKRTGNAKKIWLAGMRKSRSSPTGTLLIPPSSSGNETGGGTSFARSTTKANSQGESPDPTVRWLKTETGYSLQIVTKSSQSTKGE